MDEPVRILHIVSDMKIGGIQSFLMNVYRSINRSRVQFDFLLHYSSEDSFEPEIKELGGRIFTQQHFKFYNMRSYKNEFNSFLKKHPEYLVIQIHMRSVATMCAEISRKQNRFTIVHSHSTTNGYSFKALLTDILQRRSRNYADICFGCSQDANDWMFGKKIAYSEKAIVIKNGIDTKKFLFDQALQNRKRQELKINNETVVLGTVGRLIKQKNYTFLIDLIEVFSNKKENCILLIVGDGELRQELINIVENKDIEDRVLFLGERKDVPELLQAIDIFLLASKNEGLGIAAVEAQAAGLPTIISPNVPDEVIVTSQCVKMKNYNFETWVNTILGFTGYERKNTFNEIEASGFDICASSKYLEEFYVAKNLQKRLQP